jgi:methionyl-tRNA formyltransferase
MEAAVMSSAVGTPNETNGNRVVWVSFDVVGLRCLEAASAAGAHVVGVVALPQSEDNPAGWCGFGGAADRLHARLVETRDINALETVKEVAQLKPDMIFVVGWSQLLREPIIGLAAQGVFGMHPALLPRHRGRAPIPWAILSGLTKTGVSLFEIVDPSADSGAIVGQVEVPIGPDETATTLYEQVLRAHVALIDRYLPLLLAGTAPRQPQDSRRASSWPKRVPRDGIIDWETRVESLYGWVRAQTRPYPGAYTFLGDGKLFIWKARPTKSETGGPAGTVVEHRKGGVVVACGDGALLLEEVGPEDSGEPPWVGGAIRSHVPIGSRLG